MGCYQAQISLTNPFSNILTYIHYKQTNTRIDTHILYRIRKHTQTHTYPIIDTQIFYDTHRQTPYNTHIGTYPVTHTHILQHTQIDTYPTTHTHTHTPYNTHINIINAHIKHTYTHTPHTIL